MPKEFREVLFQVLNKNKVINLEKGQNRLFWSTEERRKVKYL